jgi:hypothetical protein
VVECKHFSSWKNPEKRVQLFFELYPNHQTYYQNYSILDHLGNIGFVIWFFKVFWQPCEPIGPKFNASQEFIGSHHHVNFGITTSTQSRVIVVTSFLQVVKNRIFKSFQ